MYSCELINDYPIHYGDYLVLRHLKNRSMLIIDFNGLLTKSYKRDNNYLTDDLSQCQITIIALKLFAALSAFYRIVLESIELYNQT